MTKKKKAVKKTKIKKKAITKKSAKPKHKKIFKNKPVKKKKVAVASKSAKQQKGKLIGVVTHFFPHVQAAVVVVKSGSLKIGDSITIKGHTTDVNQVVDSMQIDHVPIKEAKKGDEIGLRVNSRVREFDEVFKI